ncbi:hypothetical protein CTEN210_09028 [Chaetoceros tenuissimus]|uniref:DUF6729 domain-containing protein n=1 Tax=Chaetoceros tenuissimus TaxID=426638 RepID=A0AAD3CV00_9STRA|nr:hypothetical protein CTEN210_09028 [Chaetoceros tenuissimus]
MNNQKKQRSLFGGSPREKEKRPRKRRTNAQIDLDKSKKKRENSTTTAKMRDNLCAFFGKVIEKLHIPWDKIRHRDRNVQPRINRQVEDIEDSDDLLDDDNEELVDGEYDEKQSEEQTLHPTKELSIMGKFQKAIEKRIQIESNTKDPISDEEKWLFPYLKRNKFWIRKECSSAVCQKLGIPHEAEGYYKDIRVWLPDVEFQYMPHCPTCSNNDRVAPHCYGEGDKTISRSVISVSNNYSLLSRRYICHTCEKEKQGQFTFQGYNSNSVNLLPKCHMLEFPAFLTKNLAMDWSLLDLMRPCFDNGMRPLAFRDMIHELHSKEYEKLALLHDFKNDINLITETKYDIPFSNYSDKMFYNGYVPGAKWFRSVYILFHRTIRDHLDKEVKKRGSQIIYIDTHYKAIKTFRKLNGIPLVRGVFTVANESNEWRSQTYVTSVPCLHRQTIIEAVNEVTGDDSAVQIKQSEDQNSNDIDNAIVEVETPNEPIITAVTQALQQHIGPKLKPKKAHKPRPIEQVDINFGTMLDMTYVGGIPMTYNHQYEATPVSNIATNPPPTRGPDRKQRKSGRNCPICNKTEKDGCNGGRSGRVAKGSHLYCMTTNQIVRSGPP